MSIKKLLFLTLGVIALSFSTVSCTSESQDFSDEQTLVESNDELSGEYVYGRNKFRFNRWTVDVTPRYGRNRRTVRRSYSKILRNRGTRRAYYVVRISRVGTIKIRDLNRV